MGAPPDTIERIILEFDQPQTISRLVYEVEEPARDGPRKSALKSRKTVIQAASDAGNVAGLVFFVFDLLHLDGDDVSAQPLIERKARLAALLSNIAPPLRSRRKAGLCRSRRHRHQAGGAGAVVATATAACYRQDAAR